MNPAALLPRPIHEAWTLADTQAYLQALDSRPEGPAHPDYETWRTTRYRPAADHLERAVVEHLAHLAKGGHLAMPEGSELAELSWLRGWRALIEGKFAEPVATRAIEPLRQSLSTYMRVLAHKRADGMTDEHVHQAWIDHVTGGNIDFWETNARECERFGHDVYVQSRQWQLQLGTWDPAASSTHDTFVPLTQMNLVAPGLQHLTIPVPSGELWFADWFRLNALTEMLNTREPPLPSLGSEAGAAARAQHYAESFGLGSIFVGNSSPHLTVRDGRILVGWTDDEAPDAPAIAGKVCTDLWRVSFIDKQVLAKLVAQVVAPDEVEAAMAELGEAVHATLQVTPGTHHLYCAGLPERFPMVFAMEEEDLAGMAEPMAVVSPVPLTPKATIKPKRPRP